ncbi:MAG: efflux RND transporter periplasmic adaptor subunit [Betaproteobacteria bacterium HGW-Betaproteobacteria-10]|nr:MAG: efflux RND transporter periplasmic adaptor subunit [Betaproteobacteria bacterium HGW-Betaproteobacteria-10]
MLSLIAVSLATAGGYWVGQRHVGSPELTSKSASTAADGKSERKILYYRNPMGLPDTSPTPKKDSMGMDYIAVYEGDEPDGEGAVKVSPARLQTLGVKMARAEMQVLDAAVRAVGRVEVNERLIHDISPRFEGWVERLNVSAVGDPVKRGQALFSVYSPELVSAQKELKIAQALTLDTPGADPAARQAAQRLAASARERLDNWQVVAPGGKLASRLTFTSPVAGIVLEKKAIEGMRFAPGTAIFRIADLSEVWVIADVYEQDLSRVKLGEMAAINLEAFPGRQFTARITYIYPTVNTATRTTSVRLELPNREGLLRPGMFAHVELATAGNAPRLTVPKSAVIDTGARQLVLRVVGEGKFQPQPVKIGLRGKNAVEIIEGLEAGAEVVVAANFLIDAESNLKAALATFIEPQTAAAAKRYEAMGSIAAVDVANGTISLNHEAIPALKWPAMTMDFSLADANLVKGLLPGQSVHFSFEDRGNGEFVILSLDKMAATAHGAH